jgi:hypothetical protein
MKTKTTIAAALVCALASMAFAQTPPFLTIPDKAETSLGTLDFKDGAPSAATAQRLYDNLGRQYLLTYHY